MLVFYSKKIILGNILKIGKNSDLQLFFSYLDQDQSETQDLDLNFEYNLNKRNTGKYRIRF
jgi:hypothetical protein